MNKSLLENPLRVSLGSFRWASPAGSCRPRFHYRAIWPQGTLQPHYTDSSSGRISLGMDLKSV
jgi:hypothetical protein